MFGRVKYVNVKLGYGYIDTGRNDLKDLRFNFQSGQAYKAGQTVSFDLVNQGHHAPYAINVQVREERNTSIFNTEDREKWYGEGVRLEHTFLERFEGQLPPGLRINPQKNNDPTAIDFIEGVGVQYADLKTQNTPFFTARKKSKSLDPRFTVTFNRKDYLRYKSLYPDCRIYYWVNWTQTYWNGIQVQPLEGVWVAQFEDMMNAIENGEVVLHPYKYRVNDEHNAKDSYLFDLRSDIFARLI